MKTKISLLPICVLALAACLYAFEFLPSSPNQTNYDNLRWLQLVGVSLAGLLGIISGWGNALYKRDIYFYLAANLLILWVIAGAAYFHKLQLYVYAIAEIGVLVGTYASVLIASKECNPTEKDRLVKILLISLALASAASATRFFVEIIAASFSGVPEALFSHWRPFINPRYYAKVAAWCLPALAFFLTVLIAARRWAASCIVFIFGIGATTELYFSGSRGVAISILFLSVILFILGARSITYLLFLVIWSGLGFVGAYFLKGIYFAEKSIEGGKEILRFGWSGRLDLYEHGLQLLNESPFFGAGVGRFAHISEVAEVAGPHGWWVQLLSEMGILVGGSLCLIILAGLAYSFWWLLRNAQQRDGVSGMDFRAPIFFGFTVAVIHGSVANVINDPFSQIMTAMFIFCAVRNNKASHPYVALRAVKLLPMVFWAVVLFGIAKNSLDASHCFIEVSVSKVEAGRSAPRFWSHGFIPYNETCK